MNLILFIFLLFGLQVFYWFVGRLSSKNLKDKEDYFLAGKRVVFFPLMMTFLATQVGGGLVLGAAEEAYESGWITILYPLGAALGLILLGSGIGRKLATFPVSTIAQIFELVYNSPILKRLASLLSILTLFMILVAQIIASQKFLISIGLNQSFLFILFWTIVILYTAQGGLKAVISTDIVQATFFSVVFLLCFTLIVISHPLTETSPLLQSTSFSPLSSKFCGWLLMPLLFMMIEQDMGQRCFAGASGRTVSKAAFFAGVFTLIVCIVPIFLGVLAKMEGITIPNGGSILMTTIAQLTNPWISACVACAVLAAVISTATSLINAISSNLSNDFKLIFLKTNRSLFLIKTITFLISIAAIFFSFYFNNIVDLLIQSYELSVSALFVPIFFALIRRKGEFLAALFAILCGSLGFILFRIYPLNFPREILSLILSFSGYATGYSLSLVRTARIYNKII